MDDKVEFVYKVATKIEGPILNESGTDIMIVIANYAKKEEQLRKYLGEQMLIWILGGGKLLSEIQFQTLKTSNALLNTVTKNILNQSWEAEFTKNVGSFCCKTTVLFF